MSVSINTQMIVFLACAAAGFASGLLYDVFRAIRIIFTPGKQIVFLMDMIFWLICCLLLFTVIYLTCGGELRWFEFFGLGLGMLLYFFSISHIVILSIVCTVRFIAGAAAAIAGAIAKPARKWARAVTSKSRLLKQFIQNILNKTLRFIKKILENIKRIGIILKKA